MRFADLWQIHGLARDIEVGLNDLAQLPALVVVPLDLLEQWYVHRCDLFALRKSGRQEKIFEYSNLQARHLLVYQGPRRHSLLFKNKIIVLTTYDTVRIDPRLAQQRWRFIVFDEAQKVLVRGVAPPLDRRANGCVHV